VVEGGAANEGSVSTPNEKSGFYSDDDEEEHEGGDKGEWGALWIESFQ
jgi:hypothetical protein